ncbi:hypothetical protein PCL_11333 [Purpureocillium lilacinum]|uniref:Uncharacterized protein n=1 Tax=Purpureocillium lilacinum TaxID=33203 RepID=A0A2U3DPT7_PURLI|nr:hypothetical protein PCL_11333 [Purpureocillium lilacinum]
MDGTSQYGIAATTLLILTAIPTVVTFLCSLCLAHRRRDPARTWLSHYKIAYAFFCLDIVLIFFNYLLAVLYRELDSLDQASAFNIRRAQTQTSILGSFFDEFSIIGILLTLLSLGKAVNLVHTGKVSSVDRFIQWGAYSVAGALAILNTVSFALSEKQYADDGHRFDPTALKYLRQITFAMLAIQMTLNVSILAKSIAVTAPTRAVAGVTTATRYLIICCVLMLFKTCYDVGYYAEYVPLDDTVSARKSPGAYFAILDVIFNFWPAFTTFIILFVLSTKKQDGVWTTEKVTHPSAHEMPAQPTRWGYNYDTENQGIPQGWHQPPAPIMLPAYSSPQELSTQQELAELHAPQFWHELPAQQHGKDPHVGATPPHRPAP